MPLKDALLSGLSPLQIAYLLFHAIGLVIVFRNRVRLQSSANPAIAGYALIVISTVLSYVTSTWRLFYVAQTGLRPSSVDVSAFFIWSVISWALMMAGSVLLLVALLRARQTASAS
jgi:disulfide bond formation protein DsbB